MNKKIIAIAIASALTAPAAMADVTVGGQIGAAFVAGSKGYSSATAKGTGFVAADSTKSYRGMMDSGLSKVEFSGNSGNAIFKIGLDVRTVMGGSAASIAGRDFWLGYKFNAGTLSFGRMPAALAGLEGDKYNATFLELRRTAAVATTDNSSTDTYFSQPIVQWAMKAGGATVKIQYDPSDNAGSKDGYLAASVKGQAGAIGYFAGYNNGAGGTTTATSQSSVLNADGTITTKAAAAKKTEKDSNMKIGASMKFGTVKATLMAMNADNDGAKKDSIAIMADMDMGSGLSAGVAFGTNTSGVNKKDTMMRVGLTKKLDKATRIFGGYSAYRDDSASTNKDTNALGVGMAIKF